MASDGKRSNSDGGTASGDEVDSPADPRTIWLLAVTRDDVLTALEANERRDRGAVLRVTPPFSGRMRARLHVAGGEGAYDGEATPLHLDPEVFVGKRLSYPTVDETEDALRASAESYTPERHEAWHVEAVEQWRAGVRDALGDTVTFALPDGGSHEVDVSYLG